jgi:hypothetical protein
MVRLITQNLLSCPSTLCAYPANFPLSFQDVEELEMVEAEYNPEFLRGVLSRLEWNALRNSAAEVSYPCIPSLQCRIVADRMERLKVGQPRSARTKSRPIGSSFSSRRVVKETASRPFRSKLRGGYRTAMIYDC